MKFVLISNILENSGFINFLEDALTVYPDANFIVTGDLLNTFPETREYLPESVFHELYGRLVLDEMDKLTKPSFSFFKQAPFTKSLQEMFSPMGEHCQKAQTMAHRRYEKMFSHIEAILGQNNMYFVAGAMDYPVLAEGVTKHSACFHSLDSRLVTLDGIKFAGVGGTPESVKPVRGVIDLTPNEMAAAEFTRKLNCLSGVDVLVTHVAPEESSELRDFIKKSKVKLVICRAPFVKQGSVNVSGKLAISTIKDTQVVKVGPFNTANYHALVMDIAYGKLDLSMVNTFAWSLPIIDAVAG